MEQLQGIRFDPESHVRLRIEFAKTNSKSKRTISHPQHNTFAPEPLQSQPINTPTIGSITPNEGSNSPDMNDENVRSIFQYFFTDSPESSPNIPTRNPEGKSRSQDIRKQNDPCSTLFLGNIHASHRSHVEAALQSATGFVRLKISQKDDSLLCWADFHNIQYSTAVLNALHPFSFPPAPGKQVRGICKKSNG